VARAAVDLEEGMRTIERVRSHVAEINDLLCAVNLLTWDARTQMPPQGAAARGKQLATLSKVARERLLSRELVGALQEARAESASAEEADELDQLADALELLQRLPDGLVEVLAEHGSAAQAAWERARADDDMAAFTPALEHMLELQQRLAQAIGYREHPYDALVGLYEPGMTAARLQDLFGALRGGILPLLEGIRASDVVADRRFLQRDYPESAQRDAALHFARLIGYDLGRGRLDVSAHPFEISFTRDDVRITTRFRRDYLPMSLFGTLHEAGHALYEQGVDPAYVRTVFTTDVPGLYAVAGSSYGTHESQSRLWENLVGRSRPFWRAHFGALRDHFAEQLADVDAETFYRAVNHVEPSLIRVEADEVTYNLHIMLRVDIEMALLDGSLSVRDLPEAWNAGVEATLGLEVPDDARGCLQDIHWSTGLFGSFPTYTIGNVMSAQWLEAARAQEPAITPALERGDTAPLRAWLQENVYRHGRRYSPDALLTRATGRGLAPEPYLTYLDGKYRELYDL